MKQNLNSRSTLKLISAVVKATKAFDRIQNANYLTDPINCFYKKIGKAGRVNKQTINICNVLTVRYESILLQMLKQAKVSNNDLERLIPTIWLDVWDNSRKEMDYRYFSQFIWNAYVGKVSTPDHDLKPKLMLRQFVDDIKSCREQGVLLSLAYGDRSTGKLSREGQQHLNKAYELLHKQLQKHACHLSILTGGVITEGTLSTLDNMIIKYESWLFHI